MELREAKQNTDLLNCRVCSCNLCCLTSPGMRLCFSCKVKGEPDVRNRPGLEGSGLQRRLLVGGVGVRGAGLCSLGVPASLSDPWFRGLGVLCSFSYPLCSDL